MPAIRELEESENEDFLSSEVEATPLFTNSATHKPARFFLHDSLTSGMKDNATRIIEMHGGDVTNKERRAQVVLVAETRLQSISLETLQKRYDLNPDMTIRSIWVKPFTFLKQCTRNGRYELGEQRVKKGMPGRVSLSSGP